MKVSYLSNYKTFKDKDLALALGYFDGFHIGHVKLLNETLNIAHRLNVKSGILTFNMSVKDYINKNNPSYLMTVNEKIEMAKDMGFDSIYVIELTDEFINLDRDEFINIFLKDMKAIIVGFDYSFGKNALGNSLYLSSILKEKVKIVDEISYDNHKVGTHYIKECLLNGNLSLVNTLLNREYVMEGSLFRKNKNYSFNTNNFVPKSGLYNVVIYDKKDVNLRLDIKIKNKMAEGEMLIKTDSLELRSIRLEKHNRFFIKFNSVVEN